MTAFIALQPTTGQEIARLECRDLQQAFSRMNGLRLTGGAGYVVHGGRIVASIPCRDVGHSIPDYSATDRAMKRLANRVVNELEMTPIYPRKAKPHCACGQIAVKFKDHSWVCERCMKAEATFKNSRHAV